MCSNNTGSIVGGVFGALIGVGVVVGVAWYCMKKRAENAYLLGENFTDSASVPRVNQQMNVMPAPAYVMPAPSAYQPSPNRGFHNHLGGAYSQ